MSAEYEINPETVSVAIEIALRRRDTQEKLCDLVLASNLEVAKPYARELKGDAAKTSRAVRARYPRPALVKGK